MLMNLNESKYILSDVCYIGKSTFILGPDSSTKILNDRLLDLDETYLKLTMLHANQESRLDKMGNSHCSFTRELMIICLLSVQVD